MIVNKDGQELDWSRIEAACGRIMRTLHERGVRSEDRVLVSADNSEEFALLLLALMETGVSIGLVDRGAPADRCQQLLSDAGARWFVSDHDGFNERPEATDTASLSLHDLVRLGEGIASGSEPDEAAITLTFKRWAQREDGLIIWTSGSLGRPKGVVRTGGSVLRNVERTQERMQYTAEDRLLPLLPFTHQYGLSILLLWWLARATLVLHPSSRVDRAMNVIEDRGVTVVDTVPAAYEVMLRQITRGRATLDSLSSVRMWCVGGEPLHDDLRHRFLAVMGQPLLDGYGSSEAGNIALATPDNPSHCGLPLDGVTVEVLDDHGRPVPPGEPGEIVVRTPDLMVGLLEPGGGVRPSHRTVYHTQDIGFADQDGAVRVLGRKAAVHRNGYTLYPDAIASKAGGCGRPVKVLPVENGRSGTELVFVVADPDKHPSAYWRREFAAHVATSERPNKVIVLSEFPQHSNGKTDLTALREQATSAVVGERAPVPQSVDESGHGAVPTVGSTIPFEERIAALNALATVLTERRDEVIEVLTQVSNYKTAAGEIDASVEALEGAVAEVVRYGPPALERISVLMPSNIPLYGYILYLVIPSLYARHIAFRPSRRIADQTRKLHELLSAVHGLPIELDNSGQREFLENHGSRSEALVFTGGYENAEKIRSGIRRDQLFLYFGQGVNPIIVGPDADLHQAVDGIIAVRMLNSGQDCFGPDVILVDAAVSARFCNLLVRKLEALRYGPLTDPAADYGAMFYQDAFEKTIDYLRSNSDRLAAGGEIDLMESHIRPTALIHPADTVFLPPELFAPVFNVVPYTSTDWLHELLRHPYYAERALAASVFGDMSETVELLSARHTVSRNETLLEIENGNRPFGGSGIRANYAVRGKKRHAEPLLLSKAVADHLPKESA
ncbi:aldehyde dehydrogenase family protein [Streptomyces buecherae]|uniref:aldehyde dehydrogenase family protein n=1 Tax=Streptomyces buecherae TaxID=2763006 RepID=UPI0033FE51E8